MRSIWKATAFVVLMLCAGLLAQHKKEDQPANAQVGTDSSECQPKRGVLPDGTLVIRNRDCTTKWVSKEEMLQAPPDQGSASGTNQAASSEAGKLKAIMPQQLSPGTDDPALKAKYQEAMNGYFTYYTAGYAHRQKVFQWQLISSKIIFVLVTLLVFSGIYFAALQFHEGMRLRASEQSSTTAKAAAAEAGDRSLTRSDTGITKFSASPSGIEVSSPVLGVIILVISLAFFYLYLVYVYPITELF
jgi:hypothetical protein